jgi:hypothetical protein
MAPPYMIGKEILRYLPSCGFENWVNKYREKHDKNYAWWTEKFQNEFGTLAGNNHFRSSQLAENVNHGKYISQKKYASHRQHFSVPHSHDTFEFFNVVHNRIVSNYEYDLKDLFPESVKETMILYPDRFTFYLRRKTIKVDLFPRHQKISIHIAGCQNEIELRVCSELSEIVINTIIAMSLYLN